VRTSDLTLFRSIEHAASVWNSADREFWGYFQQICPSPAPASVRNRDLAGHNNQKTRFIRPGVLGNSQIGNLGGTIDGSVPN
jgi:hypothetical protein